MLNMIELKFIWSTVLRTRNVQHYVDMSIRLLIKCYELIRIICMGNKRLTSEI